jgi:hypothetical protein
MMRSRETRARRRRRHVERDRPRDRDTDTLRLLVRILARDAAREAFARTLPTQQQSDRLDTPP